MTMPLFKPERILVKPLDPSRGKDVARLHRILLKCMFEYGFENGHRYFHPHTKTELVSIFAIMECIDQIGSVDVRYEDGRTGHVENG